MTAFIGKYKYKIIITAVILAYVFCAKIIGIPCPILYVTGHPCLGCGMTRALAAAACLRFGEALGYHMMFWSVPVLYLSFLLDGRLFRGRIVNIAVHALILVGFVINYCRNIFF